LIASTYGVKRSLWLLPEEQRRCRGPTSPERSCSGSSLRLRTSRHTFEPEKNMKAIIGWLDETKNLLQPYRWRITRPKDRTSVKTKGTFLHQQIEHNDYRGSRASSSRQTENNSRSVLKEDSNSLKLNIKPSLWILP
jgi:hypothetical protein